MKWFNDLVHSGIKKSDSYGDKRAVLLVNYIAILISSGILVLIVYRYLFAPEYPVINRLYLGLALFFMPIVFNKLSLSFFSRIYLCFIPIIYIWYAFIFAIYKNESYLTISTISGLRIFLLSVSFIPYLLFDTRRPLLLFLGVLPGLISFLFFGKIMSSFGLSHEKFALDVDEYDLMQVRSFVAYVVLNGGCFVFQAIIRKNDQINQKLLHVLREKTEEIETQNEELKGNHEKLHEVNQRLENLVKEKTASIKQQHQKLIHYAHANSHHVRGPIARLQGLIQLLKLDSKADYPWFFEKVEEEANDIDQITRNISRDLDDLGIDDDEVERRNNHSL